MPGMQAAAAPAATFHQRGDNLDMPPKVGGYASGEIVITPAGFVGVVGVAVERDTQGAAAAIRGVYKMANSGITPSAGDMVAVNIANQNVVATATGDAEAGTVIADVAAGTDPVPVLLNNIPVT